MVKNHVATITLLSMIITIVSSCTDSSFVGEDLFGADQFQVSYIDSLDIKVSTVKYDSLPTSNNNNLLVGNIENEYLGNVQAESYFLFQLVSTEISEEDTFDSVTLVLHQSSYSGFWMDNESFTSKIIIEQLNSEFDFRDDGNLYNTTQLKASTHDELSILSEYELALVKDKEKTFEIRLDDEFGRSLFEEFRTESDVSSLQSEFEEYINGFRIRLDSAIGGPVTGFLTDSTQLKLYFTNNDAIPVEKKEVSFHINSVPHFSSIINSQIEPFNGLHTYKDAVPSSSSDDLSLIAGGIGYSAKIELPTVKDLMLQELDFLIISAELRLVPVNISNSNEDLPESLLVKVYNKNHEIVADSLTAKLQLDAEFNRDTYYVFESRGLIESMIQPYTNEEYYLWLTLDNEGIESTLTSLALGNESHGSEIILYTISNN